MDIKKLFPLVKDKQSWDAFLYLLEEEENRLIKQLEGTPSEQTLHRISGVYSFIQTLKKKRDNVLSMEKNAI